MGFRPEFYAVDSEPEFYAVDNGILKVGLIQRHRDRGQQKILELKFLNLRHPKERASFCSQGLPEVQCFKSQWKSFPGGPVVNMLSSQ